jgi:hypothetical protein
MILTGADPDMWLHCLEYVAFILNRTPRCALNGKSPIEIITGRSPDTGIITEYVFNQEVYYSNERNELPFSSKPFIGRIAGFIEGDGIPYVYKIRAQDKSIVHCSKIYPTWFDERVPMYPSTQYGIDFFSSPDGIVTSPSFEPVKLVGKTFLLPMRADRYRPRARIEGYIHHDSALDAWDQVSFSCSENGEYLDNRVRYQQVIESLDFTPDGNFHDEYFTDPSCASDGSVLSLPDLVSRELMQDSSDDNTIGDHNSNDEMDYPDEEDSDPIHAEDSESLPWEEFA